VLYRLSVCLLNHLLPFACFNLLPFLLFISSFLFTSPLSSSLRIGPRCFQAGCRKRQLNLGYNLPWFILCSSIFVFDDLCLVDFVVIGYIFANAIYVTRDFLCS